MTDVNEEIVKAYYEAQGYVVKTNHYYVKEKFVDGKKKGQGASDIDLIIIHPKTNERAIVSVKGWHNDVVTKSNVINKWKEKDHSKLRLDEQAIKAGEEFFGNNKFRKILVLPCIDKKDYNELKDELKRHYRYDEILDFPTLIKDLIKGNKDKSIEEFNYHKNYRDSEFLQTLRLLIKYYLEPKDKALKDREK